VQELIELGQQIIGHLMKDPSIDWFVDANILQSGFVEREFGTLANVITTEEIVRELNKRPEEAKSGLRVVSQLGASNRIASETWFVGEPESFNLLMDAATQLAPSIRVRTMHIMETESVSQAIAEEKAIQQLANEGDFFAGKIMSFIEELQFADDHVKSRFKSTRRSWFRHPAKRREKIREDDFLQSDERLAGFAAANLFLRKRRTCILSNDIDYAAILKQFTDNLLWVASIIDCDITYGRAILDTVVQLWENRCKDLDHHRTICGMQLFKQVCESEDANDYGVHVPARNELLVCSPLNGQISRFVFSDKMVEFVDDFKIISSRHALQMKGVWFPRNSI
jgi:hypothetical protein